MYIYICIYIYICACIYIYMCVCVTIQNKLAVWAATPREAGWISNLPSTAWNRETSHQHHQDHQDHQHALQGKWPPLTAVFPWHRPFRFAFFARPLWHRSPAPAAMPQRSPRRQRRGHREHRATRRATTAGSCGTYRQSPRLSETRQQNTSLWDT